MKLENIYTETDDRIQVLDSHVDVYSVIREITKDGYQEEAFYVCNVADIIRKCKNWKLIMPRIKTHYAVKCNDSPIVLEVLSNLGVNFDCASKEEINKVMALGVNPNRIIFANPTKPPSHIRHAAAVGVSLMTFDNESELYKIKQYYPDAKMVIRIKCDDKTAKYVLGQKFGCDHILEAPELLQTARSLNIDVVGVSFHIGSGSQDKTIYTKAISAARHVFDVAANLGYDFKLLDIGGGYPGETGTSIKEIGTLINNALEIYFPDPSVQVIAEPGRYYVSSAFTLATNIHSIRHKYKTDPHTGAKNKLQMYYVNTGVYGALISVVFDEFYVPRALDAKPCAEYHRSIVWGPTCDGLDKIAENVLLPEMSIGDWIIFEDAGAYTLSISSQFNGFPAPKTHSIIDRENCLLLNQYTSMSDDHFVLGNSPANLRTGLGP